MLQLQSAMVLLGCFVAQTRGVMFTRAGDNVVVVREPCNLFDPQLCEGRPSRTGVYTFWEVLEGRVASIINLLGTLPENAVKCSVFFAYYAIIT